MSKVIPTGRFKKQRKKVKRIHDGTIFSMVRCRLKMITVHLGDMLLSAF